LASRRAPRIAAPSSGIRHLPTDWHAFHLFGLTLASDFRFANHLTPSCDAPDLTFNLVEHPPLPAGWERHLPCYTSSSRSPTGDPLVAVYRLDTCIVLHLARVADFFLWSDCILCHPLDPAHGYLVEIRLLGPVLSLWLELKGLPALHASAVVVGDRAVAFLSANKGGKSSLAAALMQLGYALLTDDILPLEHVDGRFRGRPGYPTMRMWPDEAGHFLGDYGALELVHPRLTKRRVPVGPGSFGSFCSRPQPLACCYLPERRRAADEDTDIEIASLSPRNAVIELVRHSFSARMVEAAGLAPQRLELFTAMARLVPMRRLTYPSGFEHLARIRQAILDDLEVLV
jgi:hypothetical protein